MVQGSPLASALPQCLLVSGLRPCALVHQSRWWGKLSSFLSPFPLEPDALWGQGLFLEKDGTVLVIFTPHRVWKLPVWSCDPVCSTFNLL